MAARKLKPIEERDPYASLVLSAFDELENADGMGMERTASQPATHDYLSPAGAAGAAACAVLGFRRHAGRMGMGRRDESMAEHGLTPNALAQGPGGFLPGPAGATGSTSNNDTEKGQQ